MTNINFATATKAELEAAGFVVTVKKSQAKSRRTTKSAWGVRPSMNKAQGTTTRSLKTANLPAAGGALQG